MNEAVSECAGHDRSGSGPCGALSTALPHDIFSCGNAWISGVSQDISYGDSSYADIPACIHYSERL